MSRPAPPCLFSYGTFGESDLIRWDLPRRDLVLDSGAFRQHVHGEGLDLSGYATWLRTWKLYADWYCNLDVIRDHALTWEAQLRLEDDYGLSPVPVFHGGEPWAALDRYLERGHTLIALGGMAARGWKRASWLVKCFELAEGKAEFHAFGMTRIEYLRDFPFFSADSSSWAMSRWAILMMYDAVSGERCQVKLNSTDVFEKSDWLIARGFDPDDLAHGRWNWRAITVQQVKEYLNFMEVARRGHGAIEHPGMTPGPKLHFAMGSGVMMFDVLRDAYDEWRAERDALPGEE